MKPSQKFLEEASKRVEPLYAQGFFYVSLNYISYYIVFDYDDPLGYYDTVVRNPELFDEEVAKLSANMQQFLDAEIVKVNNVRVSPRVVMLDIGFRKSRKNPYIVFLIRFRAPIRKGLNTYENIYESETAEYDYVAYWVFPPGSKILNVRFGEGGEKWDVVGDNVLAIYGWKGMKTSGYEYIEFEIAD